MRGLRQSKDISTTSKVNLIEMNDPNEGIETLYP